MAYTGIVVNVSVESRLALDPAARFRRVGEEGVVIQQSNAEVLVLNDTAARLLELSDGTRTIADCAGMIEADFEADHEAIVRDLLQFAEDLVAAGVAKVS